jgi:hypothetical protein
MSEEISKLKHLGAQKIHEETHIALKHIVDLLDEDYDRLNKVQFLGFISILSREYHLDLSELKERGLNHFEQREDIDKSSQGVFVIPKRKKKSTYLYLIVAAIIVMILAFMTTYSSSGGFEEKLDNSVIQTAQDVIEEEPTPEDLEDQNTTKIQETNTTETNETKINTAQALSKSESVEQELSDENKVVETPKEFTVIPRSRLWIGYIEKKTNKKKQTVIKKPLVLDPKKEWLLTLGHGNVNFSINGEIQKFQSAKSVRFLYSDGKLKQLSMEEFKILNRGRSW